MFFAVHTRAAHLLALSLSHSHHIHVFVDWFSVNHGGVFCEVNVLHFEPEAAVRRLQRSEETRRENLRVNSTREALPVVSLQVASARRWKVNGSATLTIASLKDTAPVH